MAPSVPLPASARSRTTKSALHSGRRAGRLLGSGVGFRSHHPGPGRSVPTIIGDSQGSLRQERCASGQGRVWRKGALEAVNNPAKAETASATGCTWDFINVDTAAGVTAATPDARLSDITL